MEQSPVRPICDVEDGEVRENSDAQLRAEEAAEPNVAKAPVLPSREAVESHMVTHVPFRSWCKHCVRGKSKGLPHVRQKPSERQLPTIVCDYMYMRESQHEGEERGMPILVARDADNCELGTGMLFARVVLAKGVNPYAVKAFANDIALLGHSELVIKCDQEAPIAALVHAVKEERPERIVICVLVPCTCDGWHASLGRVHELDTPN